MIREQYPKPSEHFIEIDCTNRSKLDGIEKGWTTFFAQFRKMLDEGEKENATASQNQG
jgi:hypothetical protein